MSASRKKILILIGILSHYRIDLFNELNEYHDITVAYSGIDDIALCNKFKHIFLEKYNLFNYQKGLFSIYKNYDIIIALFDFRYPLYFILSLFFKGKFIWWGIGIGNKRLLNWVRFVLMKYTNSSLIVYMDKVKDLYCKKGISEKRIVAMGNTVYVKNTQINMRLNTRRKILLLGTLNKRKRFEDVLYAYSSIRDKIKNKEVDICVVGDGSELNYLIMLSKKLNIKKNISFLGKIVEEDRLKIIMKEVLFSVSPGQAGLSILHCFAFGIPFITYNNSISGGEVDNITDGYNGFIIEPSVEVLSIKMIELINNDDLLLNFSQNAFDYYTQNCTMNALIQRINILLN